MGDPNHSSINKRPQAICKVSPSRNQRRPRLAIIGEQMAISIGSGRNTAIAAVMTKVVLRRFKQIVMTTLAMITHAIQTE